MARDLLLDLLLGPIDRRGLEQQCCCPACQAPGMRFEDTLRQIEFEAAFDAADRSFMLWVSPCGQVTTDRDEATRPCTPTDATRPEATPVAPKAEEPGPWFYYGLDGHLISGLSDDSTGRAVIRCRHIGNALAVETERQIKCSHRGNWEPSDGSFDTLLEARRAHYKAKLWTYLDEQGRSTYPPASPPVIRTREVFGWTEVESRKSDGGTWVKTYLSVETLVLRWRSYREAIQKSVDAKATHVKALQASQAAYKETHQAEKAAFKALSDIP